MQTLCIHIHVHTCNIIILYVLEELCEVKVQLLLWLYRLHSCKVADIIVTVLHTCTPIRVQCTLFPIEEVTYCITRREIERAFFLVISRRTHVEFVGPHGEHGWRIQGAALLPALSRRSYEEPSGGKMSLSAGESDGWNVAHLRE